MSKYWTTFSIWTLGMLTGVTSILFHTHGIVAVGIGIVSMTSAALIREMEKS